MKTMTPNRIRPILSLLLLLLTMETIVFNRDPSMEIIVFVLISAAFFMGTFSIYILFAGESATVHGSLHNGVRGRSRRGLDPSVIKTFPIFECSVVKGLKLGKGTLECAVCLSEFEDDETLCLLPKCSHVFHPDCIHGWLASHTTCPVCRGNLVPGSDAEAAASVTPDPVAVAAEESDSPPDHVAIAIDPAAQSEGRAQRDVINLQNRPMRPKSSQRSHFESSGRPVAVSSPAENKHD